MSVSPTALWWAAARARGPLRVPVGTAAPDVLVRLPEPGADAVWLLAVPPEQAAAGAVEEQGLSGPAVEQPNDTARLLASVVRCCWVDPTGSPWPGAPASWAEVTSVFGEFTDRDEAAYLRAAIGAVRRLHGAGWVLWDESARRVRLGPRVAGWSAADLTVLRELYRQMPAPRPAGDARAGSRPPDDATPNDATPDDATPDGPTDGPTDRAGDG